MLGRKKEAELTAMWLKWTQIIKLLCLSTPCSPLTLRQIDRLLLPLGPQSWGRGNDDCGSGQGTISTTLEGGLRAVWVTGKGRVHSQ